MKLLLFPLKAIKFLIIGGNCKSKILINNNYLYLESIAQSKMVNL